jgi:hypothetical protein
MGDKTNNFPTLNHLPISQLAEQQQPQGQLNNCVLHTIATMINIHFGRDMDGAALAKRIDENWPSMPFFYRMAPNWATTPRQARRIIQLLAEENNFTANCSLGRYSDEYLMNLLQYSPKHYPIMTFVWINDRLNLISHKGAHPYPMHSPTGMGAHTMLLAAYHPENRDKNGVPHPWGFVNSWVEEGITDIFWMSEETWKSVFKLKTLIVTLN